MRVLRRRETEGASERVDGGGGWALGPALFETHIPVDADAGALRHLLAPKTRRAAATQSREAERVGAQSLATRA